MTRTETNLPYVGTKVSIRLGNGDLVEVVIHKDGTRDIAFFGAGAAQPEYRLQLDPTSACAIGSLLCASIQSPPAV